MTVERVRSLLSSGESSRTEYKAAKYKVPASLYPTVCAFLNHEGGCIFLGVDEVGNPVGVEPNAIAEMCAAIAASTNDSSLLDPPFLLFPETVVIEDKALILLQVPESSRVHRLKGHVYDRGADGDFRVDDPVAIARIASRKQGYYSEARVYPFLRLSDFDTGTIEKARNLMTSRRADHPWKSLDTEAMLKKAGLYARDFTTGTEGYTLAAGLLFGTEETISSLIPHYKTDALLRRRDIDRYDDRIDVRVNLIEAYTLLMDFIVKHLDDPFFLEGDVRISLRDKVFREVIANSLIHREFMSASPSRFIIFGNRVEFENPCIPRLHGFLEPHSSVPFQKNPLISKFFLQLGWVEGIGSGLLNIAHYLPLYALGAWAEYFEGESFKTVIHLEPLGGGGGG
ncbi:MAG: putative DNA binding domain-containing protein, partial [Rectinemataceae bacterium]|nr:putative DNA binding domain-containing protein [Rectinemataceae bacterium]